jgi:hypothetical protein
MYFFYPYQIINLSLDLQCHPTWLMKKRLQRQLRLAEEQLENMTPG